MIVIGAGPAGAATAMRAGAAGINVTVFEKALPGRDKVCGDGLTPRAVAALDELGVTLDDAHRIAGLRMIAGERVRELDWPASGKFGSYGAVWPRRRLDSALCEGASGAGAELFFGSEALPIIEDGRAVGVTAGGERWTADLVVLAAGAQGSAARMLGALRDPDEPFGLAIRTYAETPRHGEQYLEACLTLRDAAGIAVPGYGWLFPAGDGTVNLGVGALSTMKGFAKLNLNRLCDSYRDLVADSWQLGPYLERPRAWRLPMSVTKRHGPGWVAVGDAAGLINPMNGEGIDYGLESGILAADLFAANPSTAAADYNRIVGERFDAFLRTGRRFSFLIGHPRLLRAGLAMAVGTDAVARLTLQVMGNLIDNETPGAARRVLAVADRALAAMSPTLRRLHERRTKRSGPIRGGASYGGGP